MTRTSEINGDLETSGVLSNGAETTASSAAPLSGERPSTGAENSPTGGSVDDGGNARTSSTARPDDDRQEDRGPVGRRWSVSGDDYAGGYDLSDWHVERRVDVFGKQVDAIFRLRIISTLIATFTLICLIAALGLTVFSFNKQVDKVTPAVNKSLAQETLDATAASKPKPVVPPGAQAGSAPAVAKQENQVQTGAVPAAPPPVVTSITVDLSSIGNSVVAVITVLVVAVAALAIVLLRMTYSLTAGDTSENKTVATPDNSIPLPGVELVKAVGEALATVIKGVPKKD